ncbi:MAG: metallophosphoesterase [Actinobacteria bacterium]|nr:metallophosphoesterase [Actinomycetota bacterium]
MNVAFAWVATALSLLAGSPPPQTLLAAGDIASCRSGGDEATAALVAQIPGTVAVLGDAVYEHGTDAEFRACYSWRGFRGRTRAALGNHEYSSVGAAPARRYFRLPSRGYYAYRIGAWQILVLNSNCVPAGGCERGSPQERWVREQLASDESACTLAYWHHARWSSGLHGSDESMDPIWRTLSAGGADVVLAGHDHHYERFRPIDGIRSFVVGTGGRSSYPVLRRIAGSEVVNASTYGVLRLTLRPQGYGWRFLPVAGKSFRDAGSASCR